MRVVVEFLPEQIGQMVTFHACWSADNGSETAVFPTKEEAIEFCHKRWRRGPDKVIGPTEGRRG